MLYDIKQRLEKECEDIKIESYASQLIINNCIEINWSYSGSRFGGWYSIVKDGKYINGSSDSYRVVRIIKEELENDK